jgi:SPP1 family phage portal protein
MGLETKCKLNQKALSNCVKTRLQMLFIYLNGLKNTNYDPLDIKIKFTPNLPADDLMMAQIISQLNGKISTETGIANLSFVDNPSNEMKKLAEENKANSIGADLLNGINNTKPTKPIEKMM